jgi:hypothetical protein
MASSDSSSANNIAILISMGFDRDHSMQALNACGNVERAIESLLSGDCDYSSITCSERANERTHCVHADISQYSDACLGRSACTSIALTMACSLLKVIPAPATASWNPAGVINSAFLQNAIKEGIQLHSDLIGRCEADGVEHSSVDEIYRACENDSSHRDHLNKNITTSEKIISTMQLLREPKQGILTNSTNHPLELEAILNSCQDQQSYIAAVIIKPPETVLVLLPPHCFPSSSYVLLDSHPRPHQLPPHYPAGSYALIHPTLADLAASLKQIFPAMDLGDDVPEMMSMMYNSFDVYSMKNRKMENVSLDRLFR